MNGVPISSDKGIYIGGKWRVFTGLYRDAHLCKSVFTLSSFYQSIRHMNCGFVETCWGIEHFYPCA